MSTEEKRRLFFQLYQAQAEAEVDKVMYNYANGNDYVWCPLGDNKNNFGVIENQQSSPIAALIEKITNSIDAILMRRCHEKRIDPRSEQAPQTMHQAIEYLFSSEHKNWNLVRPRRDQAKSIQIIASGPKRKPCLLIYDDGEGQHPDDFESTFLSLLKGNKNDIPFVQGKYNMGGTGAIVFCGKQRYHLVGSRRYDASGDFGFTLIRKHPLSSEEAKTHKNTWYEYLKINGQIPRFPMTELDLGLWNQKFLFGTIIKLYDYELPAEARGGAITHDFRRSINEFLFEPALPILLIDSKDRYPNDRVLDIDAFGLKRRLEYDQKKYVEEQFSIEDDEHDIGQLKVTCYVFKSKVEERSVKETREIIQREFFRNGMAVPLSLNGQVHGHFARDFITQTLKMPLLKHHLLIHVDCTNLNYDFRHELFMASRDRLKSGDATAELRGRLRELLIKSRLAEIYNQYKNAISVEGGDAKDLLRSFSKGLPFNKDLMKLLKQAFQIENQGENEKKPAPPTKPKVKKVKEPFHPKRHPSFFSMKTDRDDKFVTIPEGDDRIVQFATDVEDNYFDRSEDPGELKVSVLQFRRNESHRGDGPPKVDDPTKLIDVRKSSPNEGTIRIGFGTTTELRVGDELEIEAVLSGPEDLRKRFWIKIVEPRNKKKEVEKEIDDEQPPKGLPNYVLVYQEKGDDSDNSKTWDDLGQANIDIDWKVVMHPVVEENQLKNIYINMDCSVLRNFISRQGNITVEQKELSEKRYISSVYFHTIFLYSISKNKKYELKQAEKTVDLEDYLKDIFNNSYCEFLLNFGTEKLIQSLSD